MSTDARDRILARIREALRHPAPPRHLQQHNHPPLAPPPTSEDRIHWLPQVPAEWDAKKELFAKNSASLKTEWLPCSSPQELATTLRELTSTSIRIAAHQLAFGQEALDLLQLPKLLTDSPFNAQDLEQCDVGISNCECLVAQTGSILISSTSSGGRSLSVLPPHHILIAHKSQLVSDLIEAISFLRNRYGENLPAYLSFITGPSRTGDIERILVLGAHGPKKLSILFADY